MNSCGTEHRMVDDCLAVAAFVPVYARVSFTVSPCSRKERVTLLDVLKPHPQAPSVALNASFESVGWTVPVGEGRESR